MATHLNETIIEMLAEAESDSVLENLDAGVALHLDECKFCRSELELAKFVNSTLNQVPRMVAPPELLTEVIKKLDQTSIGQQRRNMVFLFVLSLSVLLAIMVWLLSGGAVAITIEMLDILHSIEIVSRIVSVVWRAIPIELFLVFTTVLLLSGAVLNRLMVRFGSHRPNETTNVTVEAS